MNPIEQERKFEYLKLLRITYAISGLLNVPIMVLLYYLNYRNAFYIFVVLCILDGLVFGHKINKIEKQLYLD